MIYVCSHGRMGNQYFQYAFARNLQIEIYKKYKTWHKICFTFESCGDLLQHTNAIYETKNENNLLRTKLLWWLRFIEVNIVKKDELFVRLGGGLNKVLNKFGIYYDVLGYSKYKLYRCKNYIVDGYFQSEKYFYENKDIICKELKNKKTDNKKLLKNINDLKNENTICVHIRRGDYISNEYKNTYLVCDNLYYEKGIEILTKKCNNYKLCVFSDDIEWVKKNYNFPKNTYYQKNEFEDYENFEIMYNCKKFVLSNSSFGWWAQYLANSKDVVAPKMWRNGFDNNDIYLEEWHVID